VAEERQALVDALAASQADITLLAHEAGTDEAEAILAFQIALVEDDNLTAPAFASIAGGEVANRAWSAAIDSEIASYEAADDPHFRARASDLRDLRDRVLRHLAGEADQIVPAGVIVAADEVVRGEGDLRRALLARERAGLAENLVRDSHLAHVVEVGAE